MFVSYAAAVFALFRIVFISFFCHLVHFFLHYIEI